MTTKPPKNILQEFCQKNKIALPTYDSVATNGGWRSNVKVNGLEVFSNIKPKKVDAENEAAERMVNLLEIKDEPPSFFINDPQPKILHLVDGENVVMEAPSQTSETAWFIFFYKKHAKADREYPVEKILVSSSRKDGVDSFIQVFVGIQMKTNPNLKKIYIYSRDKFAHSLVDAIHDLSEGSIDAEVV